MRLPWQQRTDPDLDEDEELEEEYQRQLDWERRQVGDVHIRPLLWTATPPTSSGWWWARIRGTTKAEPVFVAKDVEIQAGRVEWSSAPIQVPR